jgi:hypothetical protein
MDKDKIQTKEVWSANTFHLIVGITGLLGIIIAEGLVIREFFISGFIETLPLALAMQLLVLVCTALASCLHNYIHRVKFNLYYCKLENGIDIDYIKENYYIVNISTNGVIFINEEDYYNFNTWNVLIDKYYDYDSLFEN